MKKYLVIYGNTERDEIIAKSLLNAQKAAHKKAAEIGTIVISVTEL